MRRAAIYTRYSDEQQRATSIEDQERRCRAVAEEHGLTVDEAFVFSDAAITGRAKGLAKREGYRRLVDAIESRQVDVVIVDEVSRLTRSAAEGGRLMELAESTGIRYLTADGIDSDRQSWTLHWLLKLTTATHEVESTSHRTIRGMLGQLERGYQIAQPPYGYTAVKDITAAGRVLGTHWVINEDQAQTIRLMYALRIDGLSGVMIAERMNREGRIPPGQHRVDAACYWRPATVLRLLANPIYRGTFVWNGSSFTRNKAKKRRKPVEEVAFPRPALRLVSDEDWYKANPGFESLYTRTYSPRGGGKKLFSGLVRCGDCQALCTPGSGTGQGSLYCPQCETAVRSGGKADWIGYSSVGAARSALRWLLHLVFAPGAARDAFHARLEARLRAGPGDELRTLQADLVKTEARIQHVKKLMVSLHEGHEHFVDEFNSAVAHRQSLSARIAMLKAAQPDVDARVVEVQQSVDASCLIDQLLDEEVVEAYKLKATLRRLLSRFELVAKPCRGVSVYRIGVKPGVFVAEMTETAMVDPTEVAFEVTVSVSAARPVVWEVSGKPWLGPTATVPNEHEGKVLLTATE